MRLRSFLLSIVTLLLFSFSGFAQESASPELLASFKQIDALTAAEFGKDNLGSVTIGVVSEGRLIWNKSYGYADSEQKVPATCETVYRIGSVTKQFTALMLLQLVETGKVHLSDPVEK